MERWSVGSAGVYRGEDRRLERVTEDGALRRPLAVSAAALGVTWLVTLVLPGAGTTPLAAVLATAAAALAVVVGTLCIARWLVAGEATALLLGAASAAYGALVVGVGELGPVLAPSPTAVRAAAAVRPAAIVVLLALLAGAVAAREVDTRLRGGLVAGAALAALAVLTLLLWLAPGLGAVVEGGNPPGSRPSLLLAGTAALAVVYGVRGWRRARWLDATFALLLASIALSAVTRLLAAADLVPAEPGSVAGEVVRLAGLAAALRGALGQLLLGYRHQSRSLHSTRMSLATAEDRIRATQERAEEQAHEARSALAAIEGATSTLEHYRDRLPPATRDQLASAVRGEIARLQRLVSPEPEPLTTFSVAELTAPLAAAERARGTALVEDVAPQLRALGRPGPMADALRTLLDNARRYAPGSPVTMRAAAEDGRVVIRVEDRGPGVRPEERGAVFARGVRGAAGRDVDGSGLGLFLAAEAVQEQGGQLWVDDRPGGGASFALSLPPASPAPYVPDPPAAPRAQAAEEEPRPTSLLRRRI